VLIDDARLADMKPIFRGIYYDAGHIMRGVWG